MRLRRLPSTGLSARAGGLLCLLLAPFQIAAQESVTVRGRVADASDNPIAGAVVLLHAIGDDAGREMARDTADAAGAFELTFAMEVGPLYFVATRVDGGIFMADPFRQAPADPILLRAGAGVAPLQLDGLTPGPAEAPVAARGADDSGRAILWVLLIGAVLAAVVAWIVARGRRRAPRTRELMLEIARLDEAHAAAGAHAEGAYRARRDELRGRLREALELDPDADRH